MAYKGAGFPADYMIKPKPHWTQFFQVCAEFSMRNLMIFVTTVNATFLLDYLAIAELIDDDTFFNCYCALLLAGGGVYGFGKWQDDKTARTRIDAASDIADDDHPGKVKFTSPRKRRKSWRG